MAQRTAYPGGVIIAVYSGWFATLVWWKTLGLLPATALLVVFTCWYMSVQHELIHGHPTRVAGSTNC